MKTFPVVRDLIVDREFMFDALKQVKAWIPIDGTYDIGPGLRMKEKRRQMAYELSKCFTCGICLEDCPNVNEQIVILGTFVFSHVSLIHVLSTGEQINTYRLDRY